MFIQGDVRCFMEIYHWYSQFAWLGITIFCDESLLNILCGCGLINKQCVNVFCVLVYIIYHFGLQKVWQTIFLEQRFNYVFVNLSWSTVINKIRVTRDSLGRRTGCYLVYECARHKHGTQRLLCYVRDSLHIYSEWHSRRMLRSHL